MLVDAFLQKVEEVHGGSWLLIHDFVDQLGVEDDLEPSEHILDLVKVVHLGFLVRPIQKDVSSESNKLTCWQKC